MIFTARAYARGRAARMVVGATPGSFTCRVSCRRAGCAPVPRGARQAADSLRASMTRSVPWVQLLLLALGFSECRYGVDPGRFQGFGIRSGEPRLTLSRELSCDRARLA